MVWPASDSSRAPSGVTATRNSLSLTSRGTPMITRIPLGCLPESLPPSVGGQKQGGHRLRVRDPPVVDGPDGLLERHDHDLDVLLRFALRDGPAGEQLDALVGDTR